MNIKKLDKLLKDSITEYFEKNKKKEDTEDLLQLLVDNLAKVVYCCMDDSNQRHPKSAAEDFSHIVSNAIERTAAKVNMTKDLYKVLGMPLPGERVN